MFLTRRNISTLQFSKRLQKAGLEERIANELTKAINEIETFSVDELTIKEVKNQSLNIPDILAEALIASIRSEMEILKKDIIIKLGSIMAAGVGIIAILIKF